MACTWVLTGRGPWRLGHTQLHSTGTFLSLAILTLLQFPRPWEGSTTVKYKLLLVSMQSIVFLIHWGRTLLVLSPPGRRHTTRLNFRGWKTASTEKRPLKKSWALEKDSLASHSLEWSRESRLIRVRRREECCLFSTLATSVCWREKENDANKLTTRYQISKRTGKQGGGGGGKAGAAAAAAAAAKLLKPKTS